MASISLESTGNEGQEDPIRCIFFAEFHHIAGPKITCQVRLGYVCIVRMQMIKRSVFVTAGNYVILQVPDNYISKDIFDNVSVYIIPKAQLQRSTITM